MDKGGNDCQSDAQGGLGGQERRVEEDGRFEGSEISGEEG